MQTIRNILLVNGWVNSTGINYIKPLHFHPISLKISVILQHKISHNSQLVLCPQRSEVDVAEVAIEGKNINIICRESGVKELNKKRGKQKIYKNYHSWAVNW